MIANVLKAPIRGATFMMAILASLMLAIRISIWKRRGSVIRTLSLTEKSLPKGEKLLVVVTHVSPPSDDHHNQSQSKLKKLISTLDGLSSCFAHCEVDIWINTYGNFHVVDQLPSSLKAQLNMENSTEFDPMSVGYRAQDIFAANADQYDWFIYLEDDIVIRDSWHLEKLRDFNSFTSDASFLLLPSMYEYVDGQKTYVNLGISRESCGWNDLTTIRANGIVYAECQNPHSACYFLNRDQMRHWLNSGQKWRGKVCWADARDGASTFCLFECFKLYKPSPDNLHFLEVQHADEKYYQLAEKNGSPVLDIRARRNESI